MKKNIEFIKYQSLGNDFVLLDYLDNPKPKFDSNWSQLVQQLCERNFGIGADGVLLISINSQDQLQAHVFNADGSNGYKCLNGLRCVADYLVKHKNYPGELQIFMGDKLMLCQVAEQVTINVGIANYVREQKLTVADKTFTGHVINIGNPHLVIFEKVDREWLQQNGAQIEHHPDFPERTNVEFVWPIKDGYQVLVYERGVGLTMACGTGAAAVMQALLHLNKITPNTEINIQMPGGIIKSHIENNDIIQTAPANLVFSGTYHG